MLVDPNAISPSQNFLKPGTIKHILDCFENNNPDKLPPRPIVRVDTDGDLVAVDGHNLIAVMAYLGRHIEVYVAKSADDGLLGTADSIKQRNQDLKEKFETVLEARDKVQAKGIQNFQDLIAKNHSAFPN